ncbi:hypothetical protein KBY58_00290 [Cyanobium sp. HWJ4-Hawea]|uniref:hypothetical protein n=1 Tax=Cyanobium sp. HWJ4-Hawea TaxID=2823713 RepID=UPI0020CD448E|nr:hypothetical protein [Cyanobium sp. HWJ4-Hawea]MCP9807874.1 hypothetical protein [Cyanobium sp. HWJ4-Hawea]
MNTNNEEASLDQVLRETNELLNKLDSIKEKSSISESKSLKEPKQEYKKMPGNHREVNTQETRSIVLLGVILLLAFLALILQVASEGNKAENTVTGEIEGEKTKLLENPDNDKSSRPTTDPSSSSQEQVYFTGIDLLVTNNLCNKKGNFCIYGLASLVTSEKGSANYKFEDTAKGESVTIRGMIEILNINKEPDGTRTFSFSFRDNQAETTSGWAAAGHFMIDKNAKQPGIMSRFQTSESFGPKTPVGLENTSYLFPR